MPQMGSTRVQEDAEDQGVRRQKEEPNKRTKKEEQTKRNKQRKTTRQYRGETDTGGWEDSSLTLRMTAEPRNRTQNDSLSQEVRTQNDSLVVRQISERELSRELSE